MSKKFKIELNSAGVREMLKSQEVQNLVTEKASGIRNRCGDGYDQDLVIGKNRAIAMVWADTPKAKYSNAKYNTILKAVGN